MFDTLGRQCKEDASKVVMVGLDAARFDAVSDAEIKELDLTPWYQKKESLGDVLIPFEQEIQVKVGHVLQRLTEIGLGSYLFDPIAISYLIKPDMYQTAAHYVAIEVNQSHEGQTRILSKEEHQSKRVGTHLTV